MKIRLATLLGETAELVVSYAGQEVTVTHRPGAFTSMFSQEMDDLSIDDALLKVVEDFGVTDDSDQPIPVSKEGVSLLPVKFKRTILREILEAQYPNSPRTADDSSSF